MLTAVFSFLNLIPRWVLALAIAALSLTSGRLLWENKGLVADLAIEKTARANETIERQEMVINHAEDLRKLESQHAAEQQRKEEAYEAQLNAVKTAGAADRADAQRMRSKLAAYTSGSTRPGETDAAACQRAKDRLPLVGTLLAEGIDLEAESREIIGRRDAEIELLMGQIKADRAACSPATKG